MRSSLARRFRSALALVATAMCAACVTIGQPFPTPGVPSFALGNTTQADIQKMYGNPFRTGVEDGDVKWTYVNYKLRVFGQQCTRDLVVRFNAQGTVKSFTYNSSTAGSCG